MALAESLLRSIKTMPLPELAHQRVPEISGEIFLIEISWYMVSDWSARLGTTQWPFSKTQRLLAAQSRPFRVS
ncbi:MAG: hypothetical protein Q7U74_02160, partial [Saprospiraceae bacterium]|nr:hypothetical protein [Saprospiraceae bacterium]